MERELTSSDRIEQIEHILALSFYNEDSPEVAIVDLLSDIMHWCKDTKVNFGRSLTAAQNDFDAEMVKGKMS
jgi:hypothetical protein